MSGAIGVASLLGSVLEASGDALAELGSGASQTIATDLQAAGFLTSSQAAAVEENPWVGFIGVGLGALTVFALTTPVGAKDVGIEVQGGRPSQAPHDGVARTQLDVGCVARYSTAAVLNHRHPHLASTASMGSIKMTANKCCVVALVLDLFLESLFQRIARRYHSQCIIPCYPTSKSNVPEIPEKNRVRWILPMKFWLAADRPLFNIEGGHLSLDARHV